MARVGVRNERAQVLMEVHRLAIAGCKGLKRGWKLSGALYGMLWPPTIDSNGDEFNTARFHPGGVPLSRHYGGMNQQELSVEIADRLRTNSDELKAYWSTSSPVHHCFIDDLLPEETARQIYASLPDPNTLMLRESIKERKRVGIKLEQYAPEMSAILFAFQEPAVIKVVADITGLSDMTADASLYGSGISQMLEGDFLLPHLDNSHDGDGKLYRVLNLLYYVTPDWPEDKGGNLELWDKSMKQRKEVHAAFNRLVLMETHTDSVHSVSRVTQPGGVRACISNYYFSATPANHREHIHKTTFFARPEDGTVKKIQLGLEGSAKKILSRFLSNDKSKTKHRRG